MSGTPDPYRRCGLRANPFAHDDADHAPGWVDRGLPGPAVAGGRCLVQVIGVKGAGKTTTLRRWQRAEPGPWHYVPPDLRRFAPLPVAPLVYWDEADRALPVARRRAWRVAARRGATVVAGTHADLGAEAAAAGLAVRTVPLPGLSAVQVRSWAALRFAAVTTGDGAASWDLPEDVAADVAARCAGSWRAAGDLLHVWLARQVTSRAR